MKLIPNKPEPTLTAKAKKGTKKIESGTQESRKVKTKIYQLSYL
jgi:hypothetical protein